MSEKLKVKAVIFDLGSTLIEYEKIPWDVLAVSCIANVRNQLIKSGFSPPDENEFHTIFEGVKNLYRREASQSLIEWTIPQATGKVLDKLKIPKSEDLIRKLFDAYYEPVAREIYAYDDTKETLSELKEKIGTIGLVSNTIFPESTHVGELKKYSIYEYFDFKVFSSTFGVRKPHSDIFYQAANLAGMAPSECVYIGDRYIEDITGPEHIGMSAILKIKPGREYPSDMPETVRKIDHLHQLREHLDF